ncbi:MAG: hypothetical protein FJX53_06800 [Alphaproteobacteria bacterium]|nr:hypothetical protein [Alphaproteobacteria bacterium]
MKAKRPSRAESRTFVRLKSGPAKEEFIGSTAAGGERWAIHQGGATHVVTTSARSVWTLKKIRDDRRELLKRLADK